MRISRGRGALLRQSWYVLLSLLAAASVLLIPETSALASIRHVLGSLLTLFLPGYALLLVLFPNAEHDLVVQAVLSVVTSVVLTYIIGLILNFTGLGLGTPVVTLFMLLTTALCFLGGHARRRTGT